MTQTATTRPFAWSYSRLKNFETCARRSYHYDILKDIVEPESEQLRYGHALHGHFEARIKQAKPLPLGFGQYESILARIVGAPGDTLGEQKLALTPDFAPVAFFGKNVWFRTVIDAAKIRHDTNVASVFDWKTGKITADLTQLQLMAMALFAHHANLERVRAGLVFVAHDHVETAEFAREDQTEVWAEILPRVRAMQRGVENQSFPPNPSGLCRKYCGVKSCEFFQKGGR